MSKRNGTRAALRNRGRFLASVLGVFLLVGCAGQDDASREDVTDLAASSGTVTADGIDLHYTVEGTGIPCIVIGSSVYHSRTLSANLRQSFQFAFVDSRFFALSDADPVDVSSVTMDVIVDEIDQVRQALGLDKTAILGHSMFALVALEYAKKYPDRVSHVIMVAMSPHFNEQTFQAGADYWETQASEERKALWGRNTEGLDARLATATPSEAFTARYLADAPRRWFEADYDGSWLWEGVEFHGELLNHFLFSRLSEYEVRPGLDRVTMPVFLAVGKYDFGIPHYLWEEYQEDFADLSFNVFETSGHHPMLEEQELFDEKLIAWVTGN
jgi:proline iminopeptidase